MGLLVTCPVASEPSDIYIDSCPQQVGQVQKLLFQRRLDSGSLNSFTISSANPNVIASWSGLLSASDDTKVVQTPFVSEPTFTIGEKLTYGSPGGNETIGGIELNVGTGPTFAEFKFLNTVPRSMEGIRTWRAEDMVIYPIDEHGRIWGKVDSLSSPTTFYGLPIQTNTLFVSDLFLGGFNAPDYWMLNFYLPPGWSNLLYPITPTDFDALTDMVTS